MASAVRIEFVSSRLGSVRISPMIAALRHLRDEHPDLDRECEAMRVPVRSSRWGHQQYCLLAPRASLQPAPFRRVSAATPLEGVMAHFFWPRKRQSFYHRSVIPRKIRLYFKGRAQLWRSLKTIDRDDATMKALLRNLVCSKSS